MHTPPQRRKASSTFNLIFAAFAAAQALGCAGRSASPTEVAFKSGATLIARADVFESISCDRANRCAPTGGSDIIVTMEPRFATGSYRLYLALGTCLATLNRNAIAVFDGRLGGRAHVNVPIVPLTSGGYALIVERDQPKMMACSVIKPA